MKKLSKTTITLLNYISNARQHAGEECSKHLNGLERQEMIAVFFALGEVEDKMYDIVGISFDDFLQNYRKFDD